MIRKSELKYSIKKLHDEIADIRRHTGAYSSYSHIPSYYESPINRIDTLEKKVDAIIEHFNIDISFNETVVTEKDKD